MNLRFSVTQVIVIELSVVLVMTGALFTFNLMEWNIQNTQLGKITELASNPQTTLEEQRQLFIDVKQVLDNQQKIYQVLMIQSQKEGLPK